MGNVDFACAAGFSGYLEVIALTETFSTARDTARSDRL
jgi:hypothetical protein